MEGTRRPPHWPIITLSYGEGGVVVADDGNGEVQHSPVSEFESQHEVAAKAALDACTGLGLSVCRVQGLAPDGAVFEMVVDAVSGTLSDAGHFRSGQVKPSSEVRRWYRLDLALRDLHLPGNRVMVVVLTSVIVLAVLGGVVVWKSYQPRSDGEQVMPVATPTPTQLPVVAPAGWQTFASWATPAGPSGVPPVIGPDGSVVFAVDQELHALDPSTGVPRWEVKVPARIQELMVTRLDGKSVLGVTDGSTSLTLVAADGKAAKTFAQGLGSDSKIVLDPSGPFIVLPGQHSQIPVEGVLVPRLVPAGATAMGAMGASVVSIDPVAGKVWFVDSEAVKFPAPAAIAAPAGTNKLVKVLGYQGGYIVSAWATAKESKSTVLVIDRVSEKSLIRVGESTVATDALDLSTLSTDSSSSLALAGRVLVNLASGKATVLPASGLSLGAGFAWSSSGASDRVRIAPDAQSVPTPPDAPVPLLLLPNGNVIVAGPAGASNPVFYSLVPSTGGTS